MFMVLDQLQQPECPECEKLVSVSDKSQELGLFLEWVLSNQGTLCNWLDARYYDEKSGDRLEEYEVNCVVESEGYYPARKSIERILADYFEIDLDKVDKERQALLKWIQNENS